MKSTHTSVAASFVLLAVGLFGVSSLRAEEVTQTGWCNSTWASTLATAHDFFDANNWYSGVITGEFGLGLGLSKVTEYIKFGEDWRGPLLFSHKNEATLWLVGDGTRDATWYLPGDMTLAPSAYKGSVNFGDAAEGRRFVLNLGGKRRILSLSGPTYYLNSPIVDGVLEINSTASLVSFRGPTGRVEGDAVLSGSLFSFYNNTAVVGGTVRMSNLDFAASNLEVSDDKYNNKIASEDIISGVLRVAGTSGEMQKISIYGSSVNRILRVGKLEVAPGGFVEFRGTSLGVNQPGEIGANLFFDAAPTMIGGVIPQAVAYDTVGSSFDTNPSLATYDAERGVRALDLETEFVQDAALVTRGDENLLVPHGTTMAISGDVTVNAVILRGGEGRVETVLSTGENGGTLHVTSGQVVIGYPRFATPSVSVPIDFGSARGCISFAQGKSSNWYAPISGTDGVVWAVLSDNLSGAGLTVWSDCDYTGDTWVNGPLYIGQGKKVFPNGARKGDVHVRGTVSFWGESSGRLVSQSINGLYGNGTVKCNKYRVSLTLGDNDANGDFEGTLSGFQDVVKIGAGVQRFGGAVVMNEQPLSVRAGRLVLDGVVSGGSQVSVASGAELGGSGTVEMPVAFADGAKFVAGVADEGLKGPLTIASLSSEGTIEVSAESDAWHGTWTVLKVSEGTLEGVAFRRGAHIGTLSLSEDGTELRASRNRGFFLKIR